MHNGCHPSCKLVRTNKVKGFKRISRDGDKSVYDTDKEKESKRISREGDKSVHDTATVQL